MIFTNTQYNRILYDAFYKSQDPRDLDRIQTVLREISAYEEKAKKERTLGCKEKK